MNHCVLLTVHTQLTKECSKDVLQMSQKSCENCISECSLKLLESSFYITLSEPKLWERSLSDGYSPHEILCPAMHCALLDIRFKVWWMNWKYTAKDYVYIYTHMYVYVYILRYFPPNYLYSLVMDLRVTCEPVPVKCSRIFYSMWDW